MDTTLLARTAGDLDRLLQHYAKSDAEVGGLLRALEELLHDAQNGNVAVPVEWRDIPGDRAFSEGGLRKYSDLESAYASFKIEATGGETAVLSALRAKRGP